MTVIKADGRDAPFSERSLFESVNQATADWHTPDQVRRLMHSVVDELFGVGNAQAVSSADIGNAVARHLKDLNPAAHIRFALAFVGRRDHQHLGREGFEDARAFRSWLSDEYMHLVRTAPAGALSTVLKSGSGGRERFDRAKLKRTALIACKGRGALDEVERLASDVTNAAIEALGSQPIVTTGQITAELLRSLRDRDDIAYLRYASTAKRFTTELDYEAEALSLQTERRAETLRRDRLPSRAADGARESAAQDPSRPTAGRR